MAYIVCEECKKRYNFDKDDFCPRCGAFNQPVKTWGMDAKGNVIRVDGVSERNHDKSFVHSEFHHEQDVRRAKGLDWDTGKKRTPPPKFSSSTPNLPPRRKEQETPSYALRVLIGVIAAVIFINILLSVLVSVLG